MITRNSILRFILLAMMLGTIPTRAVAQFTPLPNFAAQAGPRATVSAAINVSSLQPGAQAVVAVVLNVRSGFHAQSHTPIDPSAIPCDVTMDASPFLDAFQPAYPAGKDQTYPLLGRLNVYTGKTVIYVPVIVRADAQPGALTIGGEIRYQICDEKACFAPEKTRFSVQTEIVAQGSAAAITPIDPDLFSGFDPATFSRLAKAVVPAAQSASIFGHNLDQASYAFIFFAAFVIGMLFNVMPCVLPVVPLKAMSFYQVAEHQRGKSLALGLIFGLGIVTVFAALGVLVIVLRTLQWGELFGKPWFLGSIVAILAILALQLLGAFNVILPAGVYRFTPRHDTYSGNFLFGIFTAILSTPCTFGMFFGLLIWATTQPAAVGVAMLIDVGIGMAMPYVFLCEFPELARRFPRTGAWAELIKQMMGFLLLASAVFFARRFLVSGIGQHAFWWTLFAVIAAAGVFLVAQAIRYAKSRTFPVVAGVIALLFVSPSFAVAWRFTHPPIDWQPFSDVALAEARQAGRPVMVEFTADWCGNCLALEATVFNDKRAVEAIKQSRAITLRADLTKEDAPGWTMLRQISPIGAIPLTAIYVPQSDAPRQLSGIYSTNDLIDVLTRAN